MYAFVVIDILNRQVDRLFTYRIPERLSGQVEVGSAVNVPFGKGNSLRKGYVVRISDSCGYPDELVKELDSVDEKAYSLEENMIRLAVWMRYRYGGTLYQAMSVVLPSKVKVERKQARMLVYTGTDEELNTLLSEAERKKHYARIRLLSAFRENRAIPSGILSDRLNITSATVKHFQELGLVRYEYPGAKLTGNGTDAERKRPPELNEEQRFAVEKILHDERRISLLFGVTGSGKTEVYLHLIENVLKEGKQAIVLIPEIALTYQTVMRFYERFGEQISVVHSRLSKGEKCERFERAEKGEIRVMIGPRSALFTPFPDLGLIIIDEFHESSYISEQVPKYDTVETAAERSRLTGAKVVLGSATPAIEAYRRALSGEYLLLRLTKRAVSEAVLPDVQLVDMRDELRKGNRSVFSDALREKIREKLEKKEQIMLFLNRRGYSGAVSCRACGESITCPHCSVSLNYHRDGTLRCHFCGYQTVFRNVCPSCGSNLVGTFGIGTEKVEEMVSEAFPGVKTLRMDADTTAGKNGHQEILEKFMNREADVLIGTQMIVKGHDFPNVTLVGILAADLSLNVPDYRSAERTYQLLVQAEGRAGRGTKKGDCIVQTYAPEHYAVKAAVSQNYELFYREEMLFRQQMKYPPCGSFLSFHVSGASCEEVSQVIGLLYNEASSAFQGKIQFLGPAEERILKVKDRYRMVFYMKSSVLETILSCKEMLEKRADEIIGSRNIYYSFEN